MRRRRPTRQHQKVLTLVSIWAHIVVETFGDIRCWWHDPKGVLSVGRESLRVTYFPGRLLKIMADDPGAREYVFARLDEQEQRREQQHPAAQ